MATFNSVYKRFNGVSWDTHNFPYTHTHPEYDNSKSGWNPGVSYTLAKNESTRQITITPVGTIKYWSNGTEYTFSTTTKTIPDVTGKYYIYAKNGTVTLGTVNVPWDRSDGQVPVAVMIWNATQNKFVLLGYEPHTWTMDIATHLRMHKTEGTKYVEGGQVTLRTATAIKVDPLTMFDEDIELTSLVNVGKTQTLDYLEAPVIFRNGSAGEMEIYDVGSATAYLNGGQPKVNTLSGSTWSKEDVTNNKYFCYWLIHDNDYHNSFKWIPGQESGDNLANTLAANNIQTLRTDTLEFEEMVIVGRLTMKAGNGTYSIEQWDVYDLDNSDSVTQILEDHVHSMSEITDAKVFSLKVDGTTGTTGYWTATHSEISEYVDGMAIALYTNGYAGTSAGTRININGLGDVRIYYNATSSLTTHYGSDTLIMLYYKASENKFYCHDFYYSTHDYGIRWNDDVTEAGNVIPGYTLLVQGNDGKIYSVVEGSYGTQNDHPVCTADLLIAGKILYHNSSAVRTAGYTSMGYELYESLDASTMEYWNNRDSGWAVGNRPVFLVGIPNGDGTYNLDNSSYTSFLTQDLPTTEDGKIYIWLGYMDDTYDDFRLTTDHPIYEFKDGAIRQYLPTNIGSEIEMFNSRGEGFEFTNNDAVNNAVLDFGMWENGNKAYGFRQRMDGANNKLSIYRHDNNTAGVESLNISRTGGMSIKEALGLAKDVTLYDGATTSPELMWRNTNHKVGMDLYNDSLLLRFIDRDANASRIEFDMATGEGKFNGDVNVIQNLAVGHSTANQALDIRGSGGSFMKFHDTHGHILLHNYATTAYWSIAPRSAGEMSWGYQATDPGTGYITNSLMKLSTGGDLDVLSGEIKEQGSRVYSPNNKPSLTDLGVASWAQAASLAAASVPNLSTSKITSYGGQDLQYISGSTLDAILSAMDQEFYNISQLLLSDETTLDTLQEVVDYIETNRATLDALGISGVTGLQAALDLKAVINNPAFTGTMTINNNGIGKIIGGTDGNDYIEIDGAAGDFFRVVINAVEKMKLTSTAITLAHVPSVGGTALALATDIPTNLNELTNGPGYITGYTVTEGDVTAHQAALSITESQISDLGTYAPAHTHTWSIIGNSAIYDNGDGAYDSWADLTNTGASANLVTQLSNLAGAIGILRGTANYNTDNNQTIAGIYSDLNTHTTTHPAPTNRDTRNQVAGTYLGTSHITTHPAPTSRDTRNQVAGSYAAASHTAHSFLTLTSGTPATTAGRISYYSSKYYLGNGTATNEIMSKDKFTYSGGILTIDLT